MPLGVLTQRLAQKPHSVAGQKSIVGPLIKSGSPSTTVVNYQGVTHLTGAWQATESNSQVVFGGSAACTIGFGGLGLGWQVILEHAPGGVASYTFTLRVNGASPVNGPVITITGSQTTNSDTTHTCTVNPGDLVDVMCTPSGSPASTGKICFTYEILSAGASQFPLMFGNTGATQSTANTTKFVPPVANATPQTTESFVACPCPEAITLKNLYVNLTNDPGGSGQSVTVTVRKSTNNGTSFSDTALTVTINTGSTTGHDTSDSVSFNAGDLISVKIVTSASCASTSVRFGMEADVATNGDCPQFYPGGSQTAGGAGFEWGIFTPSTETPFPGNVAAPIGWTTTNFYIFMPTVPSTGNTYTKTSRVNGANGAIQVVVTGPGNNAHDTTHTDTIAATNTVDFTSNSTSSAGVSYNYSFVMQVAQ